MDYQRCRATGDIGQYFHGRARARVESQKGTGGFDAYAAQEIWHGEHFNCAVMCITFSGNLSPSV